MGIYPRRGHSVFRQSGLSVSTLLTIVEKDAGTDRASRRRENLCRLEFDRLRAAAYRRRKRDRDALPKRIAEIRERGDALIKAAKRSGEN